jgi:uncharacterized protein
MPSPTIAHITIFPIKSLDGLDVSSSAITTGGALAFDRRWALVDAQGKFINGKRFAAIHQIRSRFHLEEQQVELSAPNLAAQWFTIGDSELCQWFSDYFGQPIEIVENTTTGFPDDPDSPGPTLISEASLTTIAQWYGLDVAEIDRRLRTNITIEGVSPFWEDCLFTQSPRQFQLGTVQIQGINPCQRCIVPTRDSYSGEGDRQFQKIFSQQRQANLPATTEASHFNHFYRIAVNSRIAPSEAEKSLRIGDRLEL